MEPLENSETSTTYLTTGKMYVAPAGTSAEDLKAGDWQEVGSVLSASFEPLGDAMEDLGHSFEEIAQRFNELPPITLDLRNVSVGTMALMFFMSKRQIRRDMGYIPSKPLFHNGKKAR